MIILIYQEETDGDIKMQYVSNDKELEEIIKEKKLYEYDYAIVLGQIYKNFNKKRK